jgi:acyl-CoA carboxylase subunit beta
VTRHSVHHDTEHAPLLAERQKISSLDVLEEGIVHVVVPENPPAHENPPAFVRAIVTAYVSAIRELTEPGIRTAS